MSNKNFNDGRKGGDRGYSPTEKGYRPTGGNVSNGHKPEKSQLTPTNPPKKK